MKKICFLILSILLISISGATLAFSDTNGHWAIDTIDEMSKIEIVNGYEDDTFRPNNDMTRAEFITIVNRLLGLKEKSNKYVPDVKREEWYSDEIRIAIEAGIVQGDEKGYIYPNNKITRQEAIIILTRAFKVEATPLATNDYIDQNEVAGWAKDYINSFIEHEYICGYEDNSLRPNGNITRAEAITIIDRIVPNILITDLYQENFEGNVLVLQNNVALRGLTINGDLIVSGGITATFRARDVSVKGNLILPNEEIEDIDEIKYNGSKFLLYESDTIEELSYINEEYGIKFAIPNSAVIEEVTPEKIINYKTNDMIVIDIKQDDAYYMKSMETIAYEESRRYDNLFYVKEKGKIDNADYVLYDDRNSIEMLVIKRENTIYTMIFFNIISDNFLDNILATIQLIPTEKIVDSESTVYKNSKLSLKFTYPSVYVLVDDSYNTGNISEGTEFFKLFIQVTTITDIEKYTFDEVKELLTLLAVKDGEVIQTDTFFVMGNEAVKFKIKNEEKLIESLYVIVGKNLYKFIFIGEEASMNEVGDTIFNDIVETLEF